MNGLNELLEKTLLQALTSSGISYPICYLSGELNDHKGKREKGGEKKNGGGGGNHVFIDLESSPMALSTHG